MSAVKIVNLLCSSLLTLLLGDLCKGVLSVTGLVPHISHNNTDDADVDFVSNGTNSTFDYYAYHIVLTVLINISSSLSAVGCSFIILTYLCFKTIRTFPGRILMILSLVILISNLLFLASGPLAAGFPDSIHLCVAIAILLHLFFLLQFSWMTITSFEITRSLDLGFKLKTEDSVFYRRKLFLVYLILGCGIPTLIVLITIIVNFSTDGLVLYGVYEDYMGSCWINHAKSAVIAFVVPLAISMIFNMVLFIFSSVLLCRASRSQAELGKGRSISYRRVHFAVFSVAGLTWLFGLIAILSRNQWTWHTFVILNSMQGFIIFLGFLCTKKVLKLYISALRRIRRKCHLGQQR